MPETMTDKEFNMCVDAYSDNLFRFLLKNVKDRDTARNIVQSAFEKLWVKHSTLEMEKAKSYLFTTGYHLMIDELRYHSRFVNVDEVDLGASREVAVSGDVKRLLDKGLQRLPDDQRSVVLLRDYEGYSYEEIASITGLSLQQVKVYIFRARTYLKNYIGKMEDVV